MGKEDLIFAISANETRSLTAVLIGRIFIELAVSKKRLQHQDPDSVYRLG